MVGVLIEMRGAVLRRRTSTAKGVVGALVLALVILLLAVSTLLTGFAHYSVSGAGTDVLATLTFGWLIGWVTGPLFTGDNSELRLDYFKLLPIAPRKLANAMLGAAFVDVSLLFSLVAFAAMIAYGAQSGFAAALVGVLATLLTLALAVVASTVAVGVLGPTVSSRRGRDFGAMVIALPITLVSLASALVPLAAKALTNGHTPLLSAVVRVLPSGWGAVAVGAASRGDWTLTALALSGLLLLIAALALVWPSVLQRRLMMSSHGGSGAKQRSEARRAPHRRLLPSTPVGAVIGKELRMYSRSMLRSVSLMIAFLVGVPACVIPSLSGVNLMLPFAGPLFTAIAAATSTNLYGDDGTALWLTLVTPAVERVDVRGRQWAWVLVVGPPGLLSTVVLTAASGQGRSWPWVLAGEPALIGGAAGLLLLISVLTPLPLSADGGPTPQRQLKANLMLIVLPVAALLPAMALLVAGSTGHSAVLSWLAVPVGVGWGGLLWWGLGRIAQRRLESEGPELLTAIRRTG